MAGPVADWLALPGEEQPVPKQEQPAEKKPPVLLPLTPAETRTAPVLSEAGLAASDSARKEQLAFAKAWRSLTGRQQIYLRALQKNNFRHAAALKILNSIEDGHRKTLWHVPSRWAMKSPNFKLALAALRVEAVAGLTSREDLLLRAHRIAETAEDGEEVFGFDRETSSHKIIGHEKKLDTALRANEQLMKATKVLGGDDNRVQVAVGPALVVQIVQHDGSVKDVSPSGLAVELPQPP